MFEIILGLLIIGSGIFSIVFCRNQTLLKQVRAKIVVTIYAGFSLLVIIGAGMSVVEKEDFDKSARSSAYTTMNCLDEAKNKTEESQCLDKGYTELSKIVVDYLEKE